MSIISTVSSICIYKPGVCVVQVTTCSLKRQMRPICSAGSLKRQRMLPTLDRHLHVQAFRLYTYLLAIFGLRSHSGRSAKRICQGFSTTSSWCSTLRELFLSWHRGFGLCKCQEAMFLLVWKAGLLFACNMLSLLAPAFVKKRHCVYPITCANNTTTRALIHALLQQNPCNVGQSVHILYMNCSKCFFAIGLR